MRLASVCVLPQHKHPISPTLRKQYETALHQWKCFGSFLRSPDKCSYKLYREPIYVCCYQRILHHLYFKVLPLAEQPLCSTSVKCSLKIWLSLSHLCPLIKCSFICSSQKYTIQPTVQKGENWGHLTEMSQRIGDICHPQRRNFPGIVARESISSLRSSGCPNRHGRLWIYRSLEPR